MPLLVTLTTLPCLHPHYSPPHSPTLFSQASESVAFQKRKQKARREALLRAKKTIDLIGSPLGLSGFFAEPSQRGGKATPEVEKALALAEALDEDGEQGAKQQEKLEKQLGEDLALLDELHGTNKRSAKSLWLRAKGVAISEARKLILQHEHDIDAEELNNRASVKVCLFNTSPVYIQSIFSVKVSVY